MRDLRTNKLKAVEGGEEHAKACRARFSPSRWQEFVADIDFFIAQIGFVSWSELLYDHGYNATPAWNSLYSSLVERLPCNERSMALLALIDPLLYALGFGVFCLAFGLKTGALALLIWGIGFPWVFFWNGASIGRGTWFAAAAVGLGLLRLRRPLAGGVALGISGAMRALPALALAGPAVAFIAHLMTRKRADRERLVILIGACATGLVLVFGNSLHSWSLAHVKEFIGNSVLHAQTRAKNVMGVERMARYGDPFRGDNEEATGGSRPLSTKVVTSVVRVALLALWVMVILRLKKSWAEASLGFMLLLIVFEISSYYCAFFCLLAPLASGRLRRWLLLLGSTLATQIPALFMSKMPSSDYYAYASALLLVAFALLAVDMLKHPWEELPTPGQSGQE